MHYIFDTSVMLDNYKSLWSYKDSTIFIPLIVIHELDKFKKLPDEIGKNARETIRILDEISNKGDIIEGIKTHNNIIIKIIIEKKEKKVLNDNKIINLAMQLNKTLNGNITLVSQDINMRVKAKAYGIKSECYNVNGVEIKDTLYKGYCELTVSDIQIDKLHKNKYIKLPKTDELSEPLYPNQMIILKSDSDNKKSALGIVKNDKIEKINDMKNIFGINPKNKEQNFALHMLLDDSIDLVTILGNAGTGKTLLGLAAALQIIHSDQNRDRLIITRPLVSLGANIGFLPGNEKEKIDPWMRPIYDNMRLLVDDEQDFKMMMDKKIISLESMTFMRGRSIPKSIILVDEAQNMTKSEMKAVLTRAGINTKVIITADIEQIDNPYLNSINNGATYVIEKFKTEPLVGHITLQKGERSRLATLVSNSLN